MIGAAARASHYEARRRGVQPARETVHDFRRSRQAGARSHRRSRPPRGTCAFLLAGLGFDIVVMAARMLSHLADGKGIRVVRRLYSPCSSATKIVGVAAIDRRRVYRRTRPSSRKARRSIASAGLPTARSSSRGLRASTATARRRCSARVGRQPICSSASYRESFDLVGIVDHGLRAPRSIRARAACRQRNAGRRRRITFAPGERLSAIASSGVTLADAALEEFHARLEPACAQVVGEPGESRKRLGRCGRRRTCPHHDVA